MNTEERIESALKEAENGCWEEIAEKFPEAKTGNMYFDACVQFWKECGNVVRLWLAINTNLLPDHWASEGNEEEEE